MSEQSKLDRAKGVRPGEELHLEALLPYLEQHLPQLDPSTLKVSQFPAGHSNLTYLLEDEQQGSFVLRRPPFGAQVKSGHDMSREFKMLSALYPVWPKVPKPYLLCEDEAILGAPFYVMERVKGVILRGPSPKGVELHEPLMRQICASFVQTMVEIHQVDLEAAGLSDAGRPQGYVERQVKGWSARYERARTDHVESVEAVARWLADHMPQEGARATLIHNDFKYDNLVLSPDDLSQVSAVLDWEMATIGDPLMDLGTSLGYWVEEEDPPVLQLFKFGPTSQPGNMTRQQLVDAYAAAMGMEVDPKDALFYFVFGLFKICGIAQQIYYRYKHGHTSDERFASLNHAVEALGQTAQRAIDTGRVSP